MHATLSKSAEVDALAGALAGALNETPSPALRSHTTEQHRGTAEQKTEGAQLNLVETAGCAAGEVLVCNTSTCRM